jgi:hypothetical protein
MASMTKFIRATVGYGHSGKRDYDIGSHVKHKNASAYRTMRALKKKYRRVLDNETDWGD